MFFFWTWHHVLLWSRNLGDCSRCLQHGHFWWRFFWFPSASATKREKQRLREFPLLVAHPTVIVFVGFWNPWWFFNGIGLWGQGFVHWKNWGERPNPPRTMTVGSSPPVFFRALQVPGTLQPEYQILGQGWGAAVERWAVGEPRNRFDFSRKENEGLWPSTLVRILSTENRAV